MPFGDHLIVLWASLIAQSVKNLPAMQETPVWFLGWEDPLENGKAYPLQYSGLENSMDSRWGHKVSDITEWLSLSLNCVIQADNPGELVIFHHITGFRDGSSGKESACQCMRPKRHGFNPWVRKILWKRKWQPIPVFLHRESNRQICLVGYSLWGHKVSGTTEQAHTSQNYILVKTV